MPFQPNPIALVDDDPSVRGALHRLLRAEGWDVVTFSSAEEFLSEPPPRRFSCLILDVHLAGMSGLELQSRLTSAGDDIPIIFISAANDAAAMRVNNGASYTVLDKPFEAALLNDALTHVLS